MKIVEVVINVCVLAFFFLILLLFVFIKNRNSDENNPDSKKTFINGMALRFMLQLQMHGER